jgi:hypothetical protein
MYFYENLLSIEIGLSCKILDVTHIETFETYIQFKFSIPIEAILK